jgi:hypothetical protein
LTTVDVLDVDTALRHAAAIAVLYEADNDLEDLATEGGGDTL